MNTDRKNKDHIEKLEAWIEKRKKDNDYDFNLAYKEYKHALMKLKLR